MYDNETEVTRTREFYEGRFDMSDYLREIADNTPGAELWASLFFEMSAFNSLALDRIDEAEALQAKRLNDAIEEAREAFLAI